MKKYLFTLALLGLTAFAAHAYAQSWFFFCPGDCLRSGVAATNLLLGKTTGIVTDKGIAQAAQDLIRYLLSFITLIAVVYIIYAGAQMLLNPTSEESSEKAKKIIISVVVGIVIIWFAWWIVSAIFYLLNNKRVAFNFVPQAYAEEQIWYVDFSTYSNRIQKYIDRFENSTYKLNPSDIKELYMLVKSAYDHMPDGEKEATTNKLYYDSAIVALKSYEETLNKDPTQITALTNATVEKGLKDFIDKEKIKIFLIKQQDDVTQSYDNNTAIEVKPSITGEAPFTVTLSAIWLYDTSGVNPIPEENYYWWIKTGTGTQKIIWHGSSLIYTLTENGTHTINLSVNSNSLNSKGQVNSIGFTSEVNVIVKPPKVKLDILVDNQSAIDKVKIATSEANKKITFAVFIYQKSYPIATSEWNFGDGTLFETDLWDPKPKIHAFKEGTYDIKLTMELNDNEDETKRTKVIRAFQLQVGDPIANILASNIAPKRGDTVVYQATNIPVVGDDIVYDWTIMQYEQKLKTFTRTPRITYTFAKTGPYSIMLTSKKDNKSDVDTREVMIDSQKPIAKFNATPLSLETPNVYVFDGTESYDPDTGGRDGLQFSWFVDGKGVTIENTNFNSSRGRFTFPEPGSHTVRLQVVKKGERSEEDKMEYAEIKVDVSDLPSVTLLIRPLVARRWDRVIFSAITPPGMDVYQWSIGNNEPKITDIGRTTNIFTESGEYDVSVRVTDTDGKSNVAKRTMYILDGSLPRAMNTILTEDDSILEEKPNVCNGHTAYLTRRAYSLKFDGSASVDAAGKNDNLTYQWTIGSTEENPDDIILEREKTSNQKSFSYSFDSLGCKKIELVVIDQNTGNRDTNIQWVKVDNVLPTFSNIRVDVENLDTDPLIVHLTMEWAIDPDDSNGVRSYTWYYTTTVDDDKDPQNPRSTLKPEITYSLPRINGQYNFYAIMRDSDGAEVDTQNISTNKTYSTPLIQVDQNPNMPIVTFKAVPKNGETNVPIRYTVTAKNGLGQDISNKVEYRWDLDGDGFIQGQATQENTQEYTYANPGIYKVKVQAKYKKFTVTKTLSITIANRVIARADVQTVGSKIIAYNTSAGKYQSVTWYLDNKKISTNPDYLIYTPESGSFPTTLTIEVKSGTNVYKEEYPIKENPTIRGKIRSSSKKLVVMSNYTDSPLTNDSQITITDPSRPLFFYLGESFGADNITYSIDLDIDEDSDLNGGVNDDADNRNTKSYNNGYPFKVPDSKKREVTMSFRLLDSAKKVLSSQQVQVTRPYIVEDVSAAPVSQPGTSSTDTADTHVPELSEKAKAQLNTMEDLIRGLGDTNAQKTCLLFVERFRNAGDDPVERMSILLDLGAEIESNPKITKEEKGPLVQQINRIIVQGNEQATRHDIAMETLKSLLYNSKFKKEIFGEAGGSPGLIYDIVDSPENYTDNNKVADAIYNKYVLNDPAIAADQKTLIYQELKLLVGDPPAKTTTPTKKPTETSSNTSGGLMGSLGSIGIYTLIGIIILGVLIWLVRFVKGLLTRSPSQSSTDSHSTSAPHDDGHGGGGHDAHEDHAVVHDEHTPDWLKSADSPFGSEDLLGAESHDTAHGSHADEHAAVPAPSATTPDWLTDTSTNHTATATTPDWLTDTSSTTAHETAGATPSWLAEDTHSTPPAPTPVPSPATPSSTPSWLEEETMPTANVPVPPVPTPTASASPSSSDDIPDWLRGADTMSTEDKGQSTKDKVQRTKDESLINEGNEGNDKSMTNDEMMKGNTSSLFDETTSVVSDVPSTPAPTSSTSALADDDIPDWLRGADTMSTEDKGQSTEEGTTTNEGNEEIETETETAEPNQENPQSLDMGDSSSDSSFNKGALDSDTKGASASDANESELPLSSTTPSMESAETDWGGQGGEDSIPSGVVSEIPAKKPAKKSSTSAKKPEKKVTKKKEPLAELPEGDHLLPPATELLSSEADLITTGDDKS